MRSQRIKKTKHRANEWYAYKTLQFIAVLAFFGLCIALLAPQPYAADNDSSYIKVGLRYGSSAPDECLIISDSGFVLGTVDSDGFNEGMPLPGYKELNVSLSGRYPVIYADDVLISNDFSGTSCIMSYSYNDDGFIEYEGSSYRGGFSFIVNSNNTLSVINNINTEEYLYSVVGSEIGASSPSEALKAQAVAARSYAVCAKGTHKESGFDVCTFTHCQAYSGIKGEHRETSRAVDETADEILTLQGRPVSGYYFKNSGGYTQNSEDVWNDKQGYLRSVKDIYSPDFPWSWRTTFQEIRYALSNTGSDPGEIKEVSITKRTQSGYVKEIKISGSRGSLVLSKEQIRTVLGFNNIKSLNFAFDVSGADINDIDETTNSAPQGNTSGVWDIYAVNADTKVRLSRNVSVISADGKTTTVRVADLFVKSADPIVDRTTGRSTNPSVDVSEDKTVDLTLNLTHDQDSNKSVDQAPDWFIAGDSGSPGRGSPGTTGTTGSTANSLAGELVDTVYSGPIVFRGNGFGHGLGLPQDSAIEMARGGFDYISILKYYYTGVEITA